MVEIVILDTWKRAAEQSAFELGELNNSITHGTSNIYGMLGEIVVADYIDAEIVRGYDFDLIRNGVTFEVKTKRCTSKPQPHFFCSVTAFNTNQNSDFYTFVRVLEDKTIAWILGSIPVAVFYQKAEFHAKGELDNYATTVDFTFKADCYNIRVSELIPFHQMVSRRYYRI